MGKKLTELIAPSFYGVHQDIKAGRHTFYWMKGGRGSTKSSFVSVEIPLLLVQHPEMHAVCLRKIGNTVQHSVFPQIEWGIDQLGLSGEFSVKRSPLKMTYLPTGQNIYFAGVDDPHKIKSLKPRFGYIGIVWFEELDQFFGMEEIRNLNQSLMRGGDKFYEFFTYNPPKSRDNWVNIESEEEDPDRLTSHTTYEKVPKEWLGEQFFKEAEKLRKKNELFYRHEYLGEVTGTGGAVFENVEDIRLTDEQVEQFDKRYYGLDFGFAVDPLAFSEMYYDSKREDLYIFGEIHQQKLLNAIAAEMIKERVGRGHVIADSAEPKSIAEMVRRGLSIDGAKKGRDSVHYGIKWLQERAHIYIDKKRCPNTYREFTAYEYERNREGEFISAFPDKNNHSIDAVRYGMSNVIMQDMLVAKRVNF